MQSWINTGFALKFFLEVDNKDAALRRESIWCCFFPTESQCLLFFLCGGFTVFILIIKDVHIEAFSILLMFLEMVMKKGSSSCKKLPGTKRNSEFLWQDSVFLLGPIWSSLSSSPLHCSVALKLFLFFFPQMCWQLWVNETFPVWNYHQPNVPHLSSTDWLLWYLDSSIIKIIIIIFSFTLHDGLTSKTLESIHYGMALQVVHHAAWCWVTVVTVLASKTKYGQTKILAFAFPSLELLAVTQWLMAGEQ